LVEEHISDRLKCSAQMKYSPWSSRLGVERGANDPIPERITLTKPHGGGQDPHRVVAPVKKRKKKQ
jgi:hypothetical protein